MAAEALPATSPAAPALSHSTAMRAARASFTGTAIEWYDYFLYGSAAAVVFPTVFFAELGDTASVLASLASFGVAFFFRPLGGILFGHLGDRLSRKQALVTTLLLMGLGTFAIGCLPTVGQVGLLAPILLIVLRMIQGVGLGGEWGGAALLVVETAPARRRGLYASACQLGVPAGQLASSGMLALFALLPEEDFLGWGWRVPFLFSGVLVIVGLYIRARLPEPPEFQSIKEANEQPKLPIAEVLRHAKKPTLLLIFVQAAATIGYYLFTVYSLSYVKNTLHLPQSWALTGVLIGAAILLFAMPAWAALSDRVGRRPVYFAGTLFIALFVVPFFWLLDTRDPVLIALAIVLALVFGYGPTGALNSALYAEQYPTRYRYTGASVAYQFSSVVAGAPAALVASALVATTGTSLSVAWYVIGAAVVSLACIAALTETSRAPLTKE
ncbi:MFS transporter [Nonomuraea polychroma]|uniref:MFS transporter n=1 Tax=Nonomuraea polychroma TaxID=46176 RepID=UPI003D8BF3D2